MKILKKISPPYYADNMTFSPCGQYIACCNSVYDIEILIYNRTGKLLTTIIPPTKSTSTSGYPVLIWQDEYLILNACMRVFVWRVIENSNNFQFLYEFGLPEKVYVNTIQYLNHKLYVALDLMYLKFQEMDLYNFQVYDLLTGEFAEQTLYRNTKLIHDGVDLNIKLAGMMISKFDERIFVSNEFIGGEKPYQWHAFLIIDDKKLLLRNNSLTNVSICENPNTGDFMLIAKNMTWSDKGYVGYVCFYYDRSRNELIDRTQSNIQYLGLSAYQDSFLLTTFDNGLEKDFVWNVAMDKQYPSKKQIGNCIITYGDDVLLTIGEKMAIVNFDN